MPQKNQFTEDMVRLLSSLTGDVQARAMFGGHSLYHSGSVFAITVGDRLYFKVDPLTQKAFEEVGSSPFTYEDKGGKLIAMSYWEAPEGTLDDPEALRPWVNLAIEAAIRAASKKKPRKKRDA